MSKTLVVYFSASGTTAAVARQLAAEENADLFEIVTEVPYTQADLDWKDKKARCTIEMADTSSRPAIKSRVENFDQYDVIVLGFPLWWGREPSIVDTFLDSYDFTGKKVLPFCTSGGSPMKNANERIQNLLGFNIEVLSGKRLGGTLSREDLKDWFDDPAEEG